MHPPVFILALILMTASAAAPAAPADDVELIPPSYAAWKAFAPRAQNAPVSEAIGYQSGYALNLASEGKPHVYGGWRCRIEGIEPGAHYRFRARARTHGIASLRESLSVLLRWRGDFGEAVAPSYVWNFRPLNRRDGAVEYDRVLEAPLKTSAVEVELVLQWTATGRVTWDEISLTRFSPPPSRKVRVAAVWLRPRNSRSPAESVERFAEYVDRVAAEHRPDVILLGEMVNRVGAKGEPEEQAEPIPGPTTEVLGERAKRHHAYIAFSMVERRGRDLFNTGVLLDRQGRIAGRYHKVQLPFEEVSRGIAPGSSFPVFATDFGTVGMLICHDASFPEAARELALKGAELILMPIWGGRQALVRARAIENGVYLATSGYDYDSEIVDPQGRVLASVASGKGPGVAVADIDLNQRFRQDWLGDWYDSVNKQRRSAPYRSRIP